jgi:hypothetical protein
MSRQIDISDLPVEYLGSQIVAYGGSLLPVRWGGRSPSLDHSEEGRSSFIHSTPTTSSYPRRRTPGFPHLHDKAAMALCSQSRSMNRNSAAILPDPYP